MKNLDRIQPRHERKFLNPFESPLADMSGYLFVDHPVDGECRGAV